MRNLCKILRKKDVGAIGIGAMIVFIAMVLVAGIAASVLVQTANKLEIQAMVTGEQTTAEVSTGIGIMDIEGNVSSSKIQLLTLTVRARAGSGDIDLGETVIEVCDGTTKLLLSYNSSATHNFNTSVNAIDGQVFRSGAWNQTNEEFGILVLNDADSSVVAATPVINRGDIVMLTINCTNGFSGLDARDDIWGMVLPEEGAPGIFAFRVPASLTDTVYDLY